MFFIGQIDGHLIVCTHTSTLYRIFPFDYLLALIQTDAHAKQLQKTSHTPHNVITTVLIPVSQVTGTHKAITFIAQQQIFPTAGISHCHIPATIAHFTFRVRTFYHISVTIYQGQFRIGNCPAYTSALGYCIFSRKIGHAGSTFRLAVSSYPAFASITAIFSKLQIQLARHLTATLSKQRQIRQIHTEETHQIQNFKAVGHSCKTGGPLFLHETPESLVRHALVGYQYSGTHI